MVHVLRRPQIHLFILLLATVSVCAAQTTSKRLSFALPDHPGKLSLDQGTFRVNEISAAPDGNRFGIRAEDHDLHFSGVLSTKPPSPFGLTASACRDQTLFAEGSKSLDAAMNRIELESSTGVHIALVLMIPKDSSSSAIRAFVASGDLCADLTFSTPLPVKVMVVPMQRVRDILQTLTFDPKAPPSFRGAFTYATAEFNQHQYAGAATAYEAALRMVDTSSHPRTLRRVTTDQISLSLRLAGQLEQTRAVNEAAIAVDPSYPLYFYNLACADAAQGDAKAARIHLQQAFDRRSNTLPGEVLPDPATDPSILKLKPDASFWAFVQSLSGDRSKATLPPAAK